MSTTPTTKPNKTRIRAWVKALRSGKYTQGTLFLRRKREEGFQYCCLGVACDLYAKDKKKSWKAAIGSDHDEVLPDKVRKWFGLKDTNPMFDDYAAIYWNDTCSTNFDSIADKIENTFLKKAVTK